MVVLGLSQIKKLHAVDQVVCRARDIHYLRMGANGAGNFGFLGVPDVLSLTFIRRTRALDCNLLDAMARFAATHGRPTGHLETSLNARSKTSATLPAWVVTLNASAMHSNVVSWKAKMKRSEEHTSELQSLSRRSYAVFCWHKK